jgi:Holliday junction DNA helicase RuvB
MIAGQDQILENLKVFVEAANQRNGFRSHPFHGPPGLGKTTLANILAMNYRWVLKLLQVCLDKPGDLAGLLTNLEERCFVY